MSQTIPADKAKHHICPWREFTPCLGPQCMAWSWSGRAVERTKTTNLMATDEGLRPSGDPTRPDGEGWERDGEPLPEGYAGRARLKLPMAVAQWWARQVERRQGRCGRAGGHDYDSEIPF